MWCDRCIFALHDLPSNPQPAQQYPSPAPLSAKSRVLAPTLTHSFLTHSPTHSRKRKRKRKKGKVGLTIGPLPVALDLSGCITHLPQPTPSPSTHLRAPRSTSVVDEEEDDSHNRRRDGQRIDQGTHRCAERPAPVSTAEPQQRRRLVVTSRSAVDVGRSRRRRIFVAVVAVTA